MSETMTETPTTPTEGTTSSEAGAETLLTGSESTSTTQQQETGQGKTEETVETKPETKTEGAPETYEFKAPEGVTYDTAVLEPFTAAAKKAGLSQEAAQTVLDDMGPALATRQAAQVKAIQDGWREASIADKEFGGEHLQANLATAKKAYDAYVNPEFAALLKETGLGNHPEMIRMMVKVGKTLSEDSFVNGARASEAPRKMQDILYNNTPK